MAVQIYVGGSWRSVSSIQVYTGGVWRTLNALKVEVSGTWRDAWSAGLQAYASYNCGGYSPYLANITKLLFSNETVSQLSATLSLARYGLGQIWSNNAGYLAGGQANLSITNVIDNFMNGFDGTNRLNSLEALTFSTEARATLSSSLATKSHAGSCQSSAKGYSGSGYNNGAQNSISFVNFSTEASGNCLNSLGQSRYNPAATYSSTKGYWAGGMPSINSIESLLFSNETVGYVSQSYSNVGAGYGTSLTKGYFIAGSYSSNIYSFTFNTESMQYMSVSQGYTSSYSSAVNYWSGSR
ncbi:MAG: hypothetical protein NTU51_02455 [Bacteroidetes bacterium]|nr:hypothetical protein [Bacteroidota bacterium]